MWFQIAALVILVAALAWALTEHVRRYAVHHSIIDVPNGRSSHDMPTPRGGGLAIVIALLFGVAIAAAVGWVADELAIALVGGGALTAVVGFRDDRRHIEAGARAALHIVAAGWAVFWLGGLPVVQVGTETIELGLAGSVLAVIGVSWLINLYNFMDGIDGIAASQALVAGTIGGGVLFAVGHTGLAVLSLLVAAAAGGFMYWNWAPARIFMGDVGSSFLGYVFGVLALASEAAGALPLIGWLMLLGVFTFDATATLLRRVVNGERWYEAHRKHAYQRLLTAGWSHARVSSAVVVTAAVLAVLATAGALRPALMPAMVTSGVAMLGALYVLVEAASPMPVSRAPRSSEEHEIPQSQGGRSGRRGRYGEAA